MTHADIEAIVLKHLHELVPGTATRTISTEAQLNEIGVDSLDLVDVASRSMQELSVKLPRSEIIHIRTLNDLVASLHRTVLAAAASDEDAASTP